MSSTVPLNLSPAMLKRLDQLGACREHPMRSSTWSDGFDAKDYEASLARVASRPEETLSLYVRVPFCPGRCLYCGCNTTVTHDSERIDRYIELLGREMALITERIGAGRDVTQLHLAGGTPNYLNDAQLTRLVEIAERHFRLLPDTDQSIECDPRRASAGQLELLYALGFRRITFGVQDLDADVQRAIGRVQSPEMVRDVYWLAREIGFDTIGFDLIHGLPQQSEASFERTVEAVLELSPDRIACYGYSRDVGIGSHQHAIDAYELPSEPVRQMLFHRAVDAFTGAGYSWIGLDTFALDTDELSIAQEEKRLRRDCIGYTANPGDHLLGLGAGAVGEVEGICVQNDSALGAWEARLKRGQLPIARGHQLSELDRRRRDGIAHMICNLELPAELASGCLEEEYAKLASYAADGLVEVTPAGLRITGAGRHFLRTLCTEHDAYFKWDRARWHFSRTN